MTAPLGCGSWQAFLQCRGGGELYPLPFSTMANGRRLDDMSDASLTLNQTTLRSWSPAVQAKCCGILAELEPWEHELALWRDGDPANDEPTWVGPIVKAVWGIDSLTLSARDLFQWFERRLLERDRTFTATDLATIFHQYAVDGLHRDPSPNIDVTSISATGILGDREVQVEAGRRAADELRELARSGLDFTMLGRVMLAGGTEVPTADLGVLFTDHFDAHELTLDGLQAETESVVIGSPAGNVGGPIRASAGGVDVDRGLVQGLANESTVKDLTSAQALADTRHDLLSESPTFFAARLLPIAPVGYEDLIPGAVADLRVQLMCRTVEGDHRLMDVRVGVAENGTESVGVEFSSLGTAEELV